jgi:hypothetical protein
MNKEQITQALTEAIDALGDIPDTQVTEKQREAYSLCVYAMEQLKSDGELDEGSEFE